MPGDQQQAGTAGDERARELAAAVHELRTPLATVRGFLETLVLRADSLDPALRDRITRVAHRNALLLGERIDALLEYERLVAEPSLHLEAGALRPAVDRVVEDSAGVLADHLVAVRVPSDAWAAIDPDALSHVLGNLLANAARHSPPGSTITVAAEDARPDIRLTVVDRGEGIPPEDLPHVCEAFYRAPGAPGNGSGLGLAVVRRYVELWGGQVAIASTLGEGTTVSVTIPRAVVGGTIDLAEPTLR